MAQAEQNHSLTAFALLAGLREGAVLAVLFTPKSGREFKSLLAEKLNLSDHFQSSSAG